MCANSHRIEHLIHMDVADRLKKVIQLCACGKVHTEIYEGRSRDSVIIKDIVKRWVKFAATAYGEASMDIL